MYRCLAFLALLTMGLPLAGCSSFLGDDDTSLLLERDYQIAGSPLALAPTYDRPSLTRQLRSLRAALKNANVSPDDQKRAVLGEMLVGNYQQALAILGALIRKNPSKEDIRRLYAECALRAGKLPLAEFTISQLSNKDSAQVLNLQGLLAYAQGKPELASSLLQQARDTKANYVPANLNLALLYLEHHRYEEAYRELKAVSDSDRTHPDVKLHLAILLAAHNQDDEAREDLEALADKYRGNPLVLYNLALVMHKLADDSDAVEALDLAITQAKVRKLAPTPFVKLRDEIQHQEEARKH